MSPSRVTSAARPSRVKGGLARARLVVPQAYHARGRDGRALDREHPHAALGAIGHERERALPVDRDPRRALAGSSVAITAGGVARRSTTVRRLSGTVLVASAGSFLVEEVTSASP